MRLLFVSLSFAPEQTGTAKTMTGRLQHLVSAGHEVQIVAGFPHYPEWRVRDGYHRRLWMRETIDGIEVLRVWHHVPRGSSAVGRALLEASFALSASAAVHLRRPDVVFGVVPVVAGGMIATLLSRRFRVPLGMFVQDLSARAAEQSGMPGARWLAGPASLLERMVLRQADALAVITEGFRRPLLDYGVDAERLRVVPDWTPIQRASIPRDDVRRKLGLPLDRPTCLHSGNMGNKQGLENVIEAARIAQSKRSDVLFVLVGDGGERTRLVQLVDSYGLKNLRFLPLQPADLYPSVLGAADVLLLNQRASVRDMSFPSKLAGYLGAGRPVLAAVAAESEAGAVLDASDGGLRVPPEDPQALIDAVHELLADPARADSLGRAASAYAEGRWAEDRLARGLEEFVEFTASAGPG